MSIWLWRCNYEYIKINRVYTENTFIAAHSKEDAERFICDALGVDTLKYRDIVAIASISGFSDTICKQITLQNAKQYLDSFSSDKIDNISFPSKEAVEAYRQKQEGVRYRYNMAEPPPQLGIRNTHIDPPSEMKKVGDMDNETLQKKYDVWGIVK